MEVDFEVGDLVQVGDERGVVTQLPVKGKGPVKITIGDEPHPRKLKANLRSSTSPRRRRKKDLGGEEHATEWVMHEKFLADERSWDGTTQNPCNSPTRRKNYSYRSTSNSSTPRSRSRSVRRGKMGREDHISSRI